MPCSLLFFLVFTKTLAEPQREWGTSIQPLKKPTANHLPVILESNIVTRFKIILANGTIYRIKGCYPNAATSILKRFTVLEGFSQLVSVFIEASQNFIFYFLHNKAAKKMLYLSAHIQKVTICPFKIMWNTWQPGQMLVCDDLHVTLDAEHAITSSKKCTNCLRLPYNTKRMIECDNLFLTLCQFDKDSKNCTGNYRKNKYFIVIIIIFFIIFTIIN